MSLTPIADLLDQAARARRLAFAISHDPAAPRLVQLAEKLEAEIIRLCRHVLLWRRAGRQEDVMAIYRLIWRDAKGNEIGSTQIECATDREALELAQRQIRSDEMTIDLWDGLRPVGRAGSSQQLDKS